MNPLFWIIILSILPVSELRGAIPYAILKAGINPISAFLIAVFLNILIIPVLFFFLDYINKFLLKIRAYKRFFEYYVNKKTSKIRKRYETLSLFAVFLFVAIPFPGTGAYTGILLSWVFKLNRIKSIAVIALGVIAAGLITTFITIGGLGIFNFLI